MQTVRRVQSCKAIYIYIYISSTPLRPLYLACAVEEMITPRKRAPVPMEDYGPPSIKLVQEFTWKGVALKSLKICPTQH